MELDWKNILSQRNHKQKTPIHYAFELNTISIVRTFKSCIEDETFWKDRVTEKDLNVWFVLYLYVSFFVLNVKRSL